MWQSGDDNVAAVILEFYQTLFSSSNPNGFDDVIPAIDTFLSHELIESLSQPFMADEIFCALKQMHPEKPPGPDGFLTFFLPEILGYYWCGCY